MDCDVSVGIATLNGVTRIDPLLASIKACTGDVNYKVVVIDDGSTERNLIQLRDLCAAHGVELREHRTNQGIPTTWNHLVERYDCTYAALLNDDVVVKPGWLEAMLYFAMRHDVGMVGLHPNRNGKIVVCGGGEMDPDDPLAQIPHRVVAANGYCFLIRKQTWDRVGRFDEEYMSFYEEVDFGVRCWQAGLQSFNIPWPIIEHEWSSTFAQNDQLLLPQVRMKNSRERFIRKWGADLPDLIPALKFQLAPPTDLAWLTPKGSVRSDAVYEANR
jgi:GT2 family glycosyltransferase